MLIPSQLIMHSRGVINESTNLSRVPECIVISKVHKLVHQLWLVQIARKRTQLLVR